KSNEYKLVGYCDIDYVGDKIERKSISKGCHFIGANLSTLLLLIIAHSCFGSSINLKTITSTSVISFYSMIILLPLVYKKNQILHSRVMHKEIKHHFISDYDNLGNFDPKLDSGIFLRYFETSKEELDQFQKNDVWKIVPLLEEKFIIETKWMFRNKLDEYGKVVRNKERLHQVDVESTFLNGIINEEKEFKVSMIGGLQFFLGHHVKLTDDGIFIHQINICLCAHFQFDPRETRHIIVKTTFRYLKDVTNLGLFFKKSDEYMLIGYCDADYAR
ncbi:hypothetical protein CR513_41346, partial [Mucuna pruriens]